MEEPAATTWEELLRCRLRAEAERYALVLAAMGIASRVEPMAGAVGLYVRAGDLQRARREIGLYIRENSRQMPPPLPAAPAGGAVQGVLAYVSLLLFLYAASRREALGLDWWNSGMARADAILGGEWWRVVTALGLHADSAHLLGNLVIGSLFGLLLAQSLGGGLAWLAILLAGAAGNLLAALVHGPGHSSVGASTAVFAALGILSALAWHQQSPLRLQGRLRGLRRWLPLGAGLMVLAYLGIGGERTDVVAHFTGFFAGVALGMVLGRAGPRLPTSPGGQLACAALAVALLVLAWGVGLEAA